MEKDRIIGVVTESDVISLLETGKLSDDLWLPSPLEIIEVPVREMINWEKTKHALANIGDILVEKVMSSPAISITPDADIEEAASVMLNEKIARLPVVEDGILIGIVARSDIVHGIGSSYSGSGGTS
jgi:CBS domain-containing protein